MSYLQMEELVLKRLGSYIKFQIQYFSEFHRTAEYIEKPRFNGTSGDLLYKTGLKVRLSRGPDNSVAYFQRRSFYHFPGFPISMFNSCHGKM